MEYRFLERISIIFKIIGMIGVPLAGFLVIASLIVPRLSVLESIGLAIAVIIQSILLYTAGAALEAVLYIVVQVEQIRHDQRRQDEKLEAALKGIEGAKNNATQKRLAPGQS